MVLIIAGPGVQTALRMITWPFRSEMRLFLILSIFSLFVCIVELILYPDLNNDDLDQQADELVNTMNNATSSDAGFTASMLEVKSIFIPCVFSLFSVIFIIGKLIQFVFFGTLSEIERSNLSRLLFRFTVFRVIILSGAINVSRLSSVFGWLVWFGALGLLHAVTLTATSRCSQLAASSLVSRREWFRLSCVLAFLLVGNWFVIRGGLYHCLVLADINVVDTVGEGVVHGRSLTSAFKTPTALGVLKSKLTGRRELIYDAVDVVAYILAESILLFCLIMHLLGGFLIHAYDRWQLARGKSWLQQTTFTYYLDFIHVLVYRFIEIAHYLHLLLWSRIFSVASLIVFLHIRFAYSMLANRIRQHVGHRRLLRYIAEHFELRTSKPANDGSKNTTKPDLEPMPGKKDGSEEPALQACAICWEPMHVWRQLPCRHEFHESCLRSWLEQNPTCPTCRRDLGIPTLLLANANRNPGVAAEHDQAAMGLLLHNLVRNPEGMWNQPAQGGAPAPTTAARAGRPTQAVHERPVANSGNTRNLFATAVGLNLGMSIGSAPVVAAAAQAAAWDAAAPGTSHNPPSASTGDQEPPGGGALQPSSSNTPQPSVTGQTTTMEDNQVRRHSFHFDGSRYFSWLPSLHVELSDVIREVFAAGADQFTHVVEEIAPRPTGHMLPLPNEPVPLTGDYPNDMSTNAATNSDAFHPDQYELIRLPSGLRQPAREISRMFPQFPLSVIVADLLRTGVPEVTVENLIARPPPPTPRSSSPSRLSMQTNTTPDTVVRPRLTGNTTDQGTGSTVASSAPSSSRATVSTSEMTEISTESNSSEPETILARRRRQMIDQARERFFSRNQS